MLRRLQRRVERRIDAAQGVVNGIVVRMRGQRTRRRVQRLAILAHEQLLFFISFRWNMLLLRRTRRFTNLLQVFGHAKELIHVQQAGVVHGLELLHLPRCHATACAHQ